MQPSHRRKVVLASASPYRKALLERLPVPFTAASPDIDESPQPGETPSQLVQRLAQAKAQALVRQFPDALIIGCDQVAVLDGEIVGKPLSRARAHQQLTRASGRRMDFLTGLCVLDSKTKTHAVVCVPYAVYFRSLTEEQIQTYLRIEQPLDCAGSFKSEGLGVALFEKMQGDDPTSLIGLPLIELTRLLRNQGLDVLAG